MTVLSTLHRPIARKEPIVQHPTAPEDDEPTTKLPDLELSTFDGTHPSEWPSFWQTFEANIDARKKLTPRDKLSYLNGVLKGTAKLISTKYPVVGSNYPFVVQALKDR